VVEFSLLVPWFLLLFIGAFDFGFYAYMLISTQNAVRVAVLNTSAGPASAADSVTACGYVRSEMDS
jgi:Flp pilus assembly protein TadG